MTLKKITFMMLCLVASHVIHAQFSVDINLDVVHSVGSENTFDRSKWITIHSSPDENDWNTNTTDLSYYANDLDGYFGRNTGILRFQASQVQEDPSKAGFPNISNMISNGQIFKNNYATNEADRHIYESKGDIIMACQQVPFYPNGTNQMGTNTGNPWLLSQTNTVSEPFGTATGEYLANWLKYYFGTGGNTGYPRPKYFEVMNEPIWPLVEQNFYGGGTLDDIYTLHNSVADAIHNEFGTDIKVGGYTTAFPDHDNAGFTEWDTRWKAFMDTCGDKMDFYSIHLYDFPIFVNKPQWRKGGRNEATIDLIEAYEYNRSGTIKPMVISEYGAQTHNLNNNQWSSLRDWYNVEAFNAMLMQFLERPNTIDKALPFAVVKAEWGARVVNGVTVPYSSRLLKRTTEPTSTTGNVWEWTDFIKFFELWNEVKGTRVDTYASNSNLQVDAYIDGKDAYVIINNIQQGGAVSFNLNLLGITGNTLNSATIKRLYLSDSNITTLDETTASNFEGLQSIKEGETIIINYKYLNDIVANESSNETKIYASTVKQPISSNTALTFNFNQSLTLGTFGEAVLRVGYSRAKALSKSPSSVMINGSSVSLPSQLYRGDNQVNRDQFFSLLEIPIPYSELQSSGNTISITFPDAGGFISSVALQVFNQSKDITRNATIPIADAATLNNPQSSYPILNSYNYNITYSAGVQRDMLIRLLEDDGFTEIGSTLLTVNPGISVVQPVTVITRTPLQNNENYIIRVILREVGQDFTTNKSVQNYNFTADASLSVDTVDTLDDNIFPYPTLTKGLVDLPNVGEAWKLYDITGSLLLTTNDPEVNINQFISGIYFFVVKGKTFKVVLIK